jgi:lipopolysaccharide/colanic/teichoic acid biosynthesis glycosyltransferase
MMYLFVKRALDIVLSAIAIVLLLPLWIILVPILKFTAEGHVFYLQKRIGYKNRYFNILKFATMLRNSPNMGTGVITLRNDPRVTSIGKYLRISKINELPQIFNVLKGDMSIVGPRPLVDRTFNAYSREVRSNIYNSKPGITGIGSIIFRDEEEEISKSADPHEFYKKHIAPYKGELEIWYNTHKSLWVDACILFLTVWVVFRPKSELVFTLFKDLPKRSVTISSLNAGSIH